MKLNMPLSNDDLRTLHAGDIVSLNGYLYTMRDAAHERIAAAAARGEQPPVELRGQLIFYAGPCPAKPGFVCGSIGPTTSARMDPYTKLMFELGTAGSIGKGNRSPEAARLHAEYSRVYFMGIGGAAAIATANIKSLEVVAYEDLGPESIKRLYVEDLKVVVGIDASGTALYDNEVSKYRR